MDNELNAYSQDPNILISTRHLTFIKSVNKYIHNDSYDELRGALTLAFVTKGKMKATINNIPIMGKRHDLIVCPPNVILHESEISQNFDARVVILSSEFLLSIINNERIKWSNIFNSHSRPIIHLDKDFLNLLDKYEKFIVTRLAMPRGKAFEAVITHFTLSLLNDLVCYVDTNNNADDSFQQVPVRQCDILFKRLITLVVSSINNEPSPNRSIQFYADRLNVSPKYLTHVCKVCSGKTAKELIDSILINRIEYLLLRSDLSVKEIAMQLGFPDVSNFGRYVKSKTGSSPRSIRANAGK
ncbi:MAG: helix-turn-helix domain-containing protein [Bacteroidales bacterium]|nr:helix-turn-helix domain-containing protein [Bacteroidales bacterium]